MGVCGKWATRPLLGCLSTAEPSTGLPECSTGHSFSQSLGHTDALVPISRTQSPNGSTHLSNSSSPNSSLNIPELESRTAQGTWGNPLVQASLIPRQSNHPSLSCPSQKWFCRFFTNILALLWTSSSTSMSFLL